MRHWLELEENIGYKNTRAIAYVLYLSFFYDRNRRFVTARKVAEYLQYLPYKIKKIVESNFSTIYYKEIEDMQLSGRRDLSWLIERYKL